MNSPTKPQAGVLSDAEILNVYHDLYWRGMIGSTRLSERMPIARAIEAEVLRRATLTSSGASQQAAPDGYALVPLKLTPEMNRVMDSEGWQWEDLLAAAEAITLEQYDEIAAAPQAAPEPADARLAAIGDAFERSIKKQDGRILAAMIREGVTELDSHIQSAFAAPQASPVDPAPAQGAEPRHWLAVLDPEQVPHQLQSSLHSVGFRKKRSAEAFIAEELDFKGWRYTLEPLYSHPAPSAGAGQAVQAVPDGATELTLANQALIDATIRISNAVQSEKKGSDAGAQTERERCAASLNLSRADAQLACGEMTAQEWRTVSAVLRWMQARVHSKV